jgi:hypothetical protein
MAVQYEDAIATLEAMFPEWDKDTLGITIFCIVGDITIIVISTMLITLELSMIVFRRILNSTIHEIDKE